MDRPPMPVHSQARRSTLPSMGSVPAATTCPRCRSDLAILRPVSPRRRSITAHLCPSLSCGYKLIVPT